MDCSKRAWPGPDLFERHPLNPILTGRDLGYPANVVCNAAAAQVGGETMLLARVEDNRGLSHLTACWSTDGVTERVIANNGVTLTIEASDAGHPIAANGDRFMHLRITRFP